MAYQEYEYRRIFHLSKREMAEEPIEDVAINFKIQEFISKKEHRERVIMEQKAKHGMT